MSIEIAIPTLGREHKQTTIQGLPHRWRKRSYLVSDHEEYPWSTKVCPYQGSGHIGEVRQWVIDHASADHVLMMDDDLKFYRRRGDRSDPEGGHRRAHPSEVGEALDEIESWSRLGHVGSVGFQGQWMNHDRDGLYVENTSCNRNWSAPAGRDLGLEKWPVLEDYHALLQILTSAKRVRWHCGVVVQHAHDDNAEGGCSRYRTPSMLQQYQQRLAEQYPDFVSLRSVDHDISGMDVPTNVRVQWKKAYRQADG